MTPDHPDHCAICGQHCQCNPCDGSVAIPIPEGPTNKEIIDLAYLGLGTTNAMFGRTDDEYANGMVLLRAMMAEYPYNRLGYDMREARLNERSGIDPQWLTAVGYSLSERICATTPGKQMLPTTARQKVMAMSQLSAFVNRAPSVNYADNTPGGAGRRWGYYDNTFIHRAYTRKPC